MNKVILTTADELDSLIRNSVRQALLEQSQETSLPANNLLDIDEACKLLKLAKQTLYGFTSKNIIPFIKRGKKLYFRKSELETWLNEGKQKTIKEIEAEISGKPTLTGSHGR